MRYDDHDDIDDDIPIPCETCRLADVCTEIPRDLTPPLFCAARPAPAAGTLLAMGYRKAIGGWHAMDIVVAYQPHLPRRRHRGATTIMSSPVVALLLNVLAAV